MQCCSQVDSRGDSRWIKRPWGRQVETQPNTGLPGDPVRAGGVMEEEGKGSQGQWPKAVISSRGNNRGRGQPLAVAWRQCGSSRSGGGENDFFVLISTRSLGATSFFGLRPSDP